MDLYLEILLFLSKEYDAGASYGSLNTTRSAIALLVGPDMAQDPRMRRFFKGVCNTRTPKPKYDLIWDPKIVLNYFTLLPENGDLNLKILSEKLITLLALITGHRILTFSIININDIRKIVNNYEIKIPNKIKTTGPKRKQPILVLPFSSENNKLCVASTLDSYLKRTRPLRSAVQNVVHFLQKTLWDSHIADLKPVDQDEVNKEWYRHNEVYSVQYAPCVYVCG